MRLGRSLIGAAGGALWGAGVAVLIQQYGVWPLDPGLAYGAPLAAAVVSGSWAGRRSRRSRRVTAALVLLALPVLAGSEEPVCVVEVSTGSGSALLADTSARSPFEVDPDVDDTIEFEVFAEAPGAIGRVWVEMGGIPVLHHEGPVSEGSPTVTHMLNEGGLDGLAGSPGIYHLGGSIDGVCSGEGYVAITGDPLTSPIAQTAAGAVGLGLLVTWLAGRPAGPVMVPGRLRPDGKPVGIDRVTVRSPGLDGEAEVHEGTEEVLVRVAGWTDAARRAMAVQHMRAERVVEISQTVESPHAASDVPTPRGDPGVQVEVPGPPAGSGQVVLASDESGVVTWAFPQTATGQIQVAADQAACIYRIPRFVPPTEAVTLGRGLVRVVGGKVATSIAFPLLDPVFGKVGERFAAAWEAKRRPYRFRTFTPDDYTVDDAPEPDWGRLAAGRSLLFVHGTFSRAHTAFGAMPGELLGELHRRYDGRVFAFDHFTLSDDPRRNVEWFHDHLPAGVGLDLDIISHSRGGLVSRVLAEKAGAMAGQGRPVTVGGIVFVASPNAGTVLAEPEYVGDLIDSYTNMLQFLPGPHVVDVFEGVITVVKQVAVGAVAGLDGLRAMRPGGEFLSWLNAGALPPARYHAVTADYEPQVAGWRRLTVNRLVDGVFHEPNDLVVPTAGTFAANGSSRFPIAEPHQLRGTDGVDHTGYFANPHVGERLLAWLDTR